TCLCPYLLTGKTCTENIKNPPACGKQNVIKLSGSPVTVKPKGTIECVYAVSSSGKVKLSIGNSNLYDRYKYCSPTEGLEVQYLNDKTLTGPTFCGNAKGKTVTSEGNLMLVRFNGYSNYEFAELTFTAYPNFNDISKRSIIYTQGIQWSGKRMVYYVVPKTIRDPENIYLAIEAFKNNTAFTFQKERREIPDYSQGLYFEECNEALISSPSLRNKGLVYKVCLDKRCIDNFMCILQLLMYVFGLVSPHVRFDRDNYVLIKTQNVDKRFRHLFDIYPQSKGETFGTPYDFGSLVHKPSNFSSVNGKITILPFDPYFKGMMGQEELVAFNDWKVLNLKHFDYKCTLSKITCKNGGYQDPKKCVYCICPENYYGKYCDKFVEVTDGCPSYDFEARDEPQKVIVKTNKLCNFLLQAPQGYKIYVKINSIKSASKFPCTVKDGVSIKYNKDKGASGLALCGMYHDVGIPAESNEVLISYVGDRGASSLSFTYYRKFDGYDYVHDIRKRSLIYTQGIQWNSEEIIHYFVNKELKDNENIHYAFHAIEENTAFKFQRELISKKTVKQALYMDYCTFTYIDTLFQEPIYRICLSKECINDIICILQILLSIFGLLPPYLRFDRNNYVIINYSNIDSRFHRFFNILPLSKGETFGTPYDFGSLAHKPSNFSSKNGQPTIVPYFGYFKYMMGQVEQVSFNDYKVVNLKYFSDKCKGIKITCKNGGYQNPKKCDQCLCPDYYYGKYCDKFKEITEGCPEYDIEAREKPQNVTVQSKKLCNFLIQAPQGYKVHVQIDYIKARPKNPCAINDAVTINYNKDKGASGLALCGAYRNINIPTESNEVLITYIGIRGASALSFTYYREFNKYDC
uniref:Peptidase M12A domain-containing protein n=1 Tax=Parastrongyloides trichosuri TaxID=131310 RepID=A0A0N4Z5H7_PARTI